MQEERYGHHCGGLHRDDHRDRRDVLWRLKSRQSLVCLDRGDRFLVQLA